MPGARSEYTATVGDKVYTFASLGSTVELDFCGDDPYIHAVEIDCTNNTNEDVYVRFWFHATASPPTNGTTDVHMLLPGIKGVVTAYLFPEAVFVDVDGVGTFALSIACVTNAGGGSGTSAPSGVVKVKLIVTEGS